MSLTQDFRYALRMMARNPGFTVVAILALALGIGANTAIFTVVNTLLLRSLPFEDADKLVLVFENGRNLNRPRNVISAANYLDWRARNRVFEAISAYIDSRGNLTAPGEPEEIVTQAATHEFFSILRAQPLLGRAFTAPDDKPGAPLTVVISHGFWSRKFGTRPDVLGKSIVLNGRTAAIVGVMPAGFRYANAKTEIWLPLQFDPARDYRANSGRNFHSIARLKRGVTIEAASAEMTRIAADLEREYNAFNAGWGTSVVPLREHVVGDVRTPVLILLGAVACVLLIACANVANLLLARATARQREIAVRASLGASRWRTVRQLLTESLCLGLGGGALGLVIALWGVEALVQLSPPSLPMRESIAPDMTVFGFSLLVSVVTSIIFGLVPALHASRTDLTVALRQGGRSVTGAGNRLRSAFVVAEVALSLMLLAGSGLLIRSFLGLQSRDTGMDNTNVTAMRVFLTGDRYPSQKRVAFLDEVLGKMRAVPGVDSAATSVFLPGAPMISGTSYYVQGRPRPEPGHQPVTQVTAVDPDFFSAMRVRLSKGRLFERRDNVMKGPRTYIVNEAFVRATFPNEEALGKRITVAMGDDIPGEIVGVVADIRHTGLSEKVRPTVYYTYAHLPIGMVHFLVRGPDSAVRGAITALRTVDRGLAIGEVRPLGTVFAESVARIRFITVLLAIFAAIAMTLAIVGLYGVLSYVVTQRTQEIGVRMAIGAQPGAVLLSLLRYGLMLTLVGIVVGTAAAAGLSGYLETLLFDVKPVDVPTFAAVIAVLLLTAVVAAWIPARRASRVDPMVALRYE